MEDGPEELEGSFDYAGQVYRLVEENSEEWRVYLGDDYLGALVAAAGADQAGPQYTISLAGAKDPAAEPATSNWREALARLIDSSAPPVGA